MMRVVMVSDIESSGGAAVAASRLATALVGAGNEVIRVVSESDEHPHPWETVHLKPSLFLRVLKRLVPQPIGRFLAERITTADLERIVSSKEPDSVNIHNVHGVFESTWSPGIVRRCANRFPTVWTMHDMWSFTGRCAYNNNCRRFEEGCDASCPTPHQYPILAADRIKAAWKMRSKILREALWLRGVSPSGWLAREAISGLWPADLVEVIPNGLPLDAYTPISRDVAREALGIRRSGPVLLAVAVDWGDRRKGGRILRDAISRLGTNLTLITMGAEDRGRLNRDPRTDFHDLGYVDDERVKVLAFSAADAVVHPALQDNLPNVILEAIACGTPVIGFPIGGVPEMVRPNVTGWLARRADSESLADAVGRSFSDLAAGVDLRDSCRCVAEQEYGDDLQAQRYEELFQTISCSMES